MFITDLFESNTRSIVVVYPGRFQPFHKGHKMVYDHLCQKYGTQNVWICTSDKVDPPRSPFNFAEKLEMMKLTGVDPSRVVQSSQPYRAMEIVSNFDPANTILLFAVSEKDMAEDPRFQFKPKKDGSPSYFQAAPSDLSQCETLDKHGYITTVPTFNFTVLGQPMRSATEVRAQFAAADEKTKKAIVNDLFGSFNDTVFNLMQTKVLEGLNEDVTQTDLNRVRSAVNPDYKQSGMNVAFTRHFADRANDPRNRPELDADEIEDLLRREYRQFGKKIAQLGPDHEAVLKDPDTQVNIPVSLDWDAQDEELDMVAKTVMRKKDFKTTTPTFTVAPKRRY